MCTQEFHGDDFFYWAHFQTPGVVEKELEADVRRRGDAAGAQSLDGDEDE